jgi:hypothetical protein
MAIGPCQAGFAGTHYYIYFRGGEYLRAPKLKRFALYSPAPRINVSLRVQNIFSDLLSRRFKLSDKLEHTFVCHRNGSKYLGEGIAIQCH